MGEPTGDTVVGVLTSEEFSSSFRRVAETCERLLPAASHKLSILTSGTYGSSPCKRRLISSKNMATLVWFMHIVRLNLLLSIIATTAVYDVS